MESISVNQDKDEFKLDEEEACAGAEAEVRQAIRCFYELKVVDLIELKPED